MQENATDTGKHFWFVPSRALQPPPPTQKPRMIVVHHVLIQWMLDHHNVEQ